MLPHKKHHYTSIYLKKQKMNDYLLECLKKIFTNLNLNTKNFKCANFFTFVMEHTVIYFENTPNPRASIFLSDFG